jgi:hypothetical protein
MRYFSLFFFVFVFFYPNTLNAQQHDYIWLTDFSISNRLGKDRLFSENSRHSFEWRNRLGLATSENTILGFQGNFTRFESGRSFSVESETSFFFNSLYKHEYSSTTWGVGPYISKIYKLSEKISLIATGFAVIESGRGVYDLNLENFTCPACLSIIPLPANLVEQRIRERNINIGMDMGAVYRLKPIISMHLTANLIQFTSFKKNAIGEPSINSSPPDLLPEFNISGSDWLFLPLQPIFHLGALFRFSQ